jgi:hypothetical protein
MEQPTQLSCTWISPGDIRTFVPVAVEASQGKILKNRCATVLARNDVVDVKRQGIGVGG